MIRAGLHALKAMPLLIRLKNSTAGATAIEYGLLVSLIALGIAGGFGVLSELIHAIFEMLGEETESVADGVNQEGTD